MRYLFILLLFLSSSTLAQVARHVVASGGVTSGEALTEGTAWTIAWSGNASAGVDPGDTIWLHAGTYDIAPWSVYPNGTAGSPIIYRNWNNERVVIRQTANEDEWCVLVYGDYVWFWGLEFTRTVADTFNAATIPLGPGDKLINCIVKNSGGNATTAFRDAVGAEIYGCIFLFDGQWWSYAGNKNHAYPIYAQNRGSTDGWKHFNDNIMGWPWSYGIHSYSSADYVQNMAMRGNVIINAGWLWRDGSQYESSLLFGVEAEAPAAVDSIIACSNYIWYNPSLGGGRGLSFNYGGRAATNLKVDSNVTMGGAYGVDMYSSNTYRSFTKNLVLTDWYPATLDETYTDNTWSATRPTGSTDSVYIRMNVYEPKRAHVIIYNWDDSDSASVNPTGFATGDTLRFYNPQNLQGDSPFVKVYAGSAFNIPMMATRWSIETPLASYSAEGHPTGALPETFPDFGVFLVTAGSGTGEPVATKLSFGTQPANTVEDVTMSSVTVRIEEADGALVDTSSRSVTIAIGTNPASGTLSGTKTVSAVNGIATFSTLSIDNAGDGYTLSATSSGLTGATSNTFNITSSAPVAIKKFSPFMRR